MGEKSILERGRKRLNCDKNGSVNLISNRYKGLPGFGENHDMIALITIKNSYILMTCNIRNLKKLSSCTVFLLLQNFVTVTAAGFIFIFRTHNHGICFPA
jgi:hypothetical protein